MTFQQAASAQGAMFDQQCRFLLRNAGWSVSDRPLHLPNVGVEIDCIADRAGLSRALIEFKGSWRGERPGLLRTDTTKKALVTGFLLQAAMYVPGRYVVMTSHLPAEGSAGDTMLRWALACGAVAAVVCVNGITWQRELEQALTP